MRYGSSHESFYPSFADNAEYLHWQKQANDIIVDG
jgi:hypothetical protein